uniref:RING-type domain-containing protein n=1 Tax=viral metagenome TaxID=1070528 RepID=A0A6C0KS52_9ZZZZ
MPCCSYCSNPNHNIRNCDSPTISIHYDNLKNIFVEVNTNTLFPQLNKFNYINRICRIYNANILKAVSVKYAYSLSNLNKHIYAANIYNHFIQLIQIPSEQYLNEEDELTWFIDRAPQRNINNNMFIPINPLRSNLLNYLEYIAAQDEFIPFTENLQQNKFKITPIVSRYKTGEKKDLDNECPICYENLKNEDIVTLNCNHHFCKTCIINTLKTNKNGEPSCALCRETICSMLVPNGETYDSVAEYCVL